MKENILIVINPKAGTIAPTEIEAMATEWSHKNNMLIDIYKTTGKDDDTNIQQRLQAKAYTRVLAAGGDGTINLVAAQLLDKNIVLGILACGSANGLATSLGLPNDWDEQFEIACTQPPFTIDTLFINGLFCVHLADIGINAELIHQYEISKASGLLGYAMHTLPTLFSSNYPYHFNISIEEREIDKKGVLLVFTNTKKYGTGSVINPEGKINDGWFEVVLYKKVSLWVFLKTFIGNRARRDASMDIYPTKRVTVNCKRPIALQVDGEYQGEYDTFTAEIKPQSLQLAVPNDFLENQ